jgi:hypothetical protein
MELDLLANATVVNDTMKFVLRYFNTKKLTSREENNSEQSKEPDYNEGEDQLEEEK